MSSRPLSASVSAPDLLIPGTSGECEDLLLDPPPFNDIGALLVPTKSIEEICQVVGKVSNDQKYSILHHHVSPPNIYPSTYSHGILGISWHYLKIMQRPMKFYVSISIIQELKTQLIFLRSQKMPSLM